MWKYYWYFNLKICVRILSDIGSSIVIQCVPWRSGPPALYESTYILSYEIKPLQSVSLTFYFFSYGQFHFFFNKTDCITSVDVSSKLFNF